MSQAAAARTGALDEVVDRSRRWPRAHVRGLAELAEQILALYRREGIGIEEASVLAGHGVEIHKDRIERTLGQIFAGECPDDAGATVALAHDLEQRFDAPLPADDLAGPLRRAASAVARLFGVTLGVTCFYLVLGGLLAGESERFSGLSGPVALLLFGVALVFLGIFEAMHTSVTQLRLADLRGLAQVYPRALAVHRRFRDEKGIASVLAGRQIVVVITVFVVAGLSSFPGMDYLPFTHTPVPAPLKPAIEIGLPGALVVLWIAQLAPQFYATRHAVAMMNTRVAGWALDLAFALNAMGIADPSRWMFRGQHGSEPIPVSPALQWEQSAAEIDGDGLLSINRRWECGESASHLRVISTTAVRRGGHPVVVDSSPILPSAPKALSISSDIAAEDGRVRQVAPTEYGEDPFIDGHQRFYKSVVPAVGSFDAGDRAQVAVEAEYPGHLQQDAVYVDRRVRFLLWRLVIEADAIRVSAVRVRSFRVGSGPNELTPIGEEVRIEPDQHVAGKPSKFSFALAFPQPGTLYSFEWEASWR